MQKFVALVQYNICTQFKSVMGGEGDRSPPALVGRQIRQGARKTCIIIELSLARNWFMQVI